MKVSGIGALSFALFNSVVQRPSAGFRLLGSNGFMAILRVTAGLLSKMRFLATFTARIPPPPQRSSPFFSELPDGNCVQYH
jgi:hypothetical protein